MKSSDYEFERKSHDLRGQEHNMLLVKSAEDDFHTSNTMPLRWSLMLIQARRTLNVYEMLVEIPYSQKLTEYR